MSSTLTRLQFTSSLFSTVVFHAYLKQEAALHFLCLVVTVFSILNHSTKDEFVRRMDMVWAHILCLYATFNLAVMLNPFLILVLIVVAIWVMESYTGDAEKATDLHAALHLVSVAGLHGYLWGLQGDAY